MSIDKRILCINYTDYQKNIREILEQTSGKLIVIIVIAAVLVVGTVAGIFAFRACGGISYQAAITDMMQMISEGKYEDAIDKYSIEGKANLTESQKQKLAMMQGMTYTADVDEKNAKIYKKGDAQFDSYCSRMTSDTAKRDQITEIVEVPVTVNVKGTVFGSPVDQYVAVGVQSTDNPKQLGYYELTAGTYTRTQDEEKVPGKTYYKKQQVNGKTLDTKIGEMDVTINGKLTATQADIRYASITELGTVSADIRNLKSGNAAATKLVSGTLYLTGGLYMMSGQSSDASYEVYGRAIYKFGGMTERRVVGFGNHYVGLKADVSGGSITISFVDNTNGDHDSANFNIADTQFYQDGVSAAYERGKAEGSGTHNITIMASVRESANPGGYTEIFEDAGAYTDLRNKVDGFYTFKVSCGGTDKWYGFWVGPRH